MTDGNLEITTEAQAWFTDAITEAWSRNDHNCCCPQDCDYTYGQEHPIYNFWVPKKGTITNFPGNSPYTYPGLFGWSSFATLDSGEGIVILDRKRTHNSFRFSGEIRLSVDDTSGGAGVVFSYVDNDNLAYFLIDSLVSQTYNFALPFSVPAYHDYYKFRSRIIVRTAGVDTVLSEKTMHMFEDGSGNDIIVRIPFYLGLGFGDDLGARVSIKYQRYDEAPFPSYFIEGKFQAHNYPELNEASTANYSNNVGYGLIATSLDPLIEVHGSSFSLFGDDRRPGPWGNEDGGKCKHFGMFYDRCEQFFLPEYWVVKLTTGGYFPSVTYYKIATNDTAITTGAEVTLDLINEPGPNQPVYFHVGRSGSTTVPKVWSHGDMKLTCKYKSFGSEIAIGTYILYETSPTYNFWQHDENYPLPFQTLTFSSNATNLELWPVISHPIPTA